MQLADLGAARRRPAAGRVARPRCRRPGRARTGTAPAPAAEHRDVGEAAQRAGRDRHHARCRRWPIATVTVRSAPLGTARVYVATYRRSLAAAARPASWSRSAGCGSASGVGGRGRRRHAVHAARGRARRPHGRPAADRQHGCPHGTPFWPSTASRRIVGSTLPVLVRSAGTLVAARQAPSAVRPCAVCADAARRRAGTGRVGRTRKGLATPRGADRAEVRRILRRQRRAHQAGRRAHRRRPQGRRRRGRRGLRDGRHHRRAARPRPPGQPAAARPRAGHAAHRRRAHLDGAAGDGDPQPRLRGPLVHRLAGRRDHHLVARQGADHRRDPGPAADGARRGRDRDRGRLPGRRPGHQGHHHAGPRRLGHHRGRAGRRAARPTSARSTPTWTASSPPTRGSCRTPGTSSRSPTRRCSSWPPAARRCCTCAASSTPAGPGCRSTSARRTRPRPAPW